MTDPAPEKERTLWVTDAEMVRRMGVGINSGRKALQQMRVHPKFPPRSIGGKTYWPSAVDFFDFWNGRRVDVPGIPADQDHAYTGRRRPGLEATKRRLAKNNRRPWPALERAKERLARDLASDAPRQDRVRIMNFAPDGNERWPAGDGKVKIRAPDGREWIEDAEPTDPPSWKRKRKLTPRTPSDAK